MSATHSPNGPHTMRFGSTAKVLAECKLNNSLRLIQPPLLETLPGLGIAKAVGAVKAFVMALASAVMKPTQPPKGDEAFAAQ